MGSAAIDLSIETHGLTKQYGGRVAAVQDLNLSIHRGETYGFIGNNGAGKTTTLRMLVGLIRPTSGTASVLGRSPGHPYALARLGALIESPTFYPYLSGRDNLRVLARYAAISDRQVAQALETVDLTDRAGDRFGTYSLGMKQRLGVAGALLKNPELVILDEPTNGLDPYGMSDMRALVHRLREEGRTILFSSHQLADVQLLSDRVGVIRAGRLVAEGTPQEITGAGGLLLGAEPLDGARRVLERDLGAERVRLHGDRLHLDLDPGRAPDVSRLLVQAGVTITELQPVRRTLEEAFFALMSGSSGAVEAS